jgi:hypothetical protein
MTNTKRQLIEEIRKEEYLVGVEQDSSLARGINNIKRQLRNALKPLSGDLYSKEIHFLFELIQNADDNIYPNNVIPKVKFILTNKDLTLENNESGFTEENVLAICKVGESSKTSEVITKGDYCCCYCVSGVVLIQ